MRIRSFPLVLLALLGACTDDPLLAPPATAAVERRELGEVWFEGTPTITRALSLVDSVRAQGTDGLLLVIDGVIQQPATLDSVPRDEIRDAEIVQGTACSPFHGMRRRTDVLIISTVRMR